MSRTGAKPKLDPSGVGVHGVSDYAIRFLFGAGISLVAGVIGMKCGPKLGGVFLGFPAILPASLTLIAKKDGKEQAAIDSEGAILGAVAMVAYAAAAFLLFTKVGVAITLVACLVLWLVVAVALYAGFRLFFPMKEPDPP